MEIAIFDIQKSITKLGLSVTLLKIMVGVSTIGLPLAALTWVNIIKKVPIEEKKINGRFNEREFVDWSLRIKEYFYYFKVPKEKQLQHIYSAFTWKVQLWWDDLQRDRRRLGFPPINTCGLMVYLLIKEYHSNDLEEILSYVNQLFVWICDDFKEAQIQLQNSSVEDVPKKEVEVPAIEIMKLFVSPVIKVYVPCMNEMIFLNSSRVCLYLNLSWMKKILV